MAAVRIATRLAKPPWALRVPVVGAPMAGVSGGKLAAAVTQAGGLGFIAVGHGRDLDGLRKEVELFRRLTDPGAKLALGFISYSSCGAADGAILREVLQEHQPEVVQFFAPAILEGSANIRAAKDAGAKVLAQVGTLSEAKEALEEGADGIIAQGREAGGHGLRSELGNGTLPLARAVVDEAQSSGSVDTRAVVLAAGGIVDGHGLAACLALGCDGVVVGTRLWASAEAIGSSVKKEALVAATGDEVIRTPVFDAIQNTYSSSPWPYPFDTTGALHNSTSKEWHGREQELALSLSQPGSVLSSRLREAEASGNADICCVHSGEGVGLVRSLDGAAGIVRRMEAEAIEAIRGLGGRLV